MNDNPTSVPPLPIKIIATALFILFVVLPITGLFISGSVASIPLMASGGLTIIGLMLGLMFIQRIIIWIYYRFYWYILAAVYVVLVVVGFDFIMGSAASTQLRFIDSFPLLSKSLMIPGAFVGVVALVIVFRHGAPKEPKDISPQSPQSPTKPAPRQKQILDTAQQIASRKRDLGIDDQ